jgi:hypothetical protein
MHVEPYCSYGPVARITAVQLAYSRCTALQPYHSLTLHVGADVVQYVRARTLLQPYGLYLFYLQP